MKSQDIVVLLKLISLHAEFFEKSSGKSDLILMIHSFEDWTDDDLDNSDIVSLRTSREHFESSFSVRSLAADTGISKSQISLSLKRMYDVGLAKNDRRLGIPKTNSKALLEFIAYGIRYVFPAKEGVLTRGNWPPFGHMPKVKLKVYQLSHCIQIFFKPSDKMDECTPF